VSTPTVSDISSGSSNVSLREAKLRPADQG
jgi:hypothetical protein